uniref:Dual specificity protein phosphatase 15 n=1 Tax=Gopherus evgoodei TaxID=1825980 RepID=A0A8C5F0H0_9SAUR
QNNMAATLKRDRENLTKNRVTHILSVHNNARPVLEDMTYLCISVSDSSSQNLIQHFKESIRFIHECRLHGGGCLIHCLAGVSRSTTILVAYLMTVTDLSWEECLAATRGVRSYVSPNFGFQQQLQEYERTLLKEVHSFLSLLAGEKKTLLGSPGWMMSAGWGLSSSSRPELEKRGEVR